MKNQCNLLPCVCMTMSVCVCACVHLFPAGPSVTVFHHSYIKLPNSKEEWSPTWVTGLFLCSLLSNKCHISLTVKVCGVKSITILHFRTAWHTKKGGGRRRRRRKALHRNAGNFFRPLLFKRHKIFIQNVCFLEDSDCHDILLHCCTKSWSSLVLCLQWKLVRTNAQGTPKNDPYWPVNV